MIERLFELSSIIIVLRFVDDPRETRMNLDFQNTLAMTFVFDLRLKLLRKFFG